MSQGFTRQKLLLAALFVITVRPLACWGEPAAPRDNFAFLTEAQTQEGSFGLVMACPAHDHGTPDEAADLLGQYRGKIGPDSPMTIWVCRAQQKQTLIQFSPLVDRIVVNPFISGDDNEFNSIKVAPWPEANHPILNRVRTIRQIVGDKELYACININGERSEFKKRKPSTDEVKWMVYAIVGAGFQGIVWRGEDSDQSVSSPVAALQEQIASIPYYGLKSQPLKLASATNGLLVSASVCGRHITLILLNPAYLANYGSHETITLPLERPVVQTEVVIPTTQPIVPDDLRALSGTPIRSQSGENAIRINLNVRGPGEMVIIEFQDKVQPGIFDSKTHQIFGRDQLSQPDTDAE